MRKRAPQRNPWKKTDPSFGLSALQERLSRSDPDLVDVSLTGYTHISPLALATALNNNVHVRSLSLQACLLGDQGLITLVKNTHCPNLVSIDLSGNGISSEGVTVLADEAHRALPSLKELNLSWNRISSPGAQALAKALEHNRNEWTSLDLSGVSVERGGGSDAGLGTDQFNRQTIGDQGAIALSEGLRTNTILNKLLLNRHDMSDVGIKALAEALHNHPSLQHLELNRTGINDKSLLALARALPDLSLRHLDVTINKVSSTSANVLADVLMRNPSLNTLLLTNNDMDCDALERLELAMRYNTHMLQMEVYGHAAGKNGSQVVSKIGSWLRINRTLHNLLQGNSPACLSEFPDYMERIGQLPNPTRLYLFLRECPDLCELTTAKTE